MSPGVLWRSVAVGVAGGLLGGFFGVGGGIVLVPLILLVLGFDRHRAHATSLGAIVLISAASFAGYAAGGEVDVGFGVVLGIGGVIGSSVGASVAHRMSPNALRATFAIVLIAAGIRMVW